MHENHAQQPIPQVPQITGPDPLDSTTVSKLAEDGIDAIAHSSEDCTPSVSRLRTGFAEGSQQDHTYLAQSGLDGGKPIVAIAQEQPVRACCHVPDHLP